MLVWGLGRHGGGLAAARLCRHLGAERVDILDAADPATLPDAARAAAEGFAVQRGDASHPLFAAADCIVPSPAIPPRAWPSAHPPRLSAEALAFALHRGRRLAITGTKGKSTTAMLCGHLLGWRVAGNSWQPLAAAVLEDPERDLVCELSSFQLWYLREQPPRLDLAVLTLLGVDHLDWHPDCAHYHACKLALLGWAERCVVADSVRAQLPPRLPLLPLLPEPRAEELPLLGAHNRANAALALTAAVALGVSEAAARQRLASVRPLPHRLQCVWQQGRWRFIDDSIATTPAATLAALAALEGPLAVILGGSDKGADFRELAAALQQRGARAVLIGTSVPRLRAAGIAGPEAASMEEAVRLALQLLPEGGSVLLSPACASLDWFQDYAERGARFAQAAQRLCPAPLSAGDAPAAPRAE
ncbi:MAG: Mur ligase family protein [Planctomycetota bacterium]|nr:Mur ligase family protein [Planctomycetota bacterium]